jgi:hypothetical protein
LARPAVLSQEDPCRLFYQPRAEPLSPAKKTRNTVCRAHYNGNAEIYIMSPERPFPEFTEEREARRNLLDFFLNKQKMVGK